jgi:MarC family membrane protein
VHAQRGEGQALIDISFSSVIVILLLVMDPLGSIPLVVSLLSEVRPERRNRVIMRECAIAFMVLVVCVFAGRSLLNLLGLSESSLNIAGGVILFLIALRMIFRGSEPIFGEQIEGEPFIVPLAIPVIAGPTAIATVILLASSAPQRRLEWVAALTVAMAISLALLLFADRISKLVGRRGLLAFERLMGLILTAIAVEMLLRGIQTFVRQL